MDVLLQPVLRMAKVSVEGKFEYNQIIFGRRVRESNTLNVTTDL